jgi:hypothetical protein
MVLGFSILLQFDLDAASVVRTSHKALDLLWRATYSGSLSTCLGNSLRGVVTG